MYELLSINNLFRFLDGLMATLYLSVSSIVLSIIFGVIFGYIMLSQNLILRIASRTFLELARIVPILVWLFILSFSLPQISRISFPKEIVVIIVFSLWGIAEMGDLVRGALSSMPPHQSQSAIALGLTPLQSEIFVVFPQIIRRLLPSVINLFTRIIKTTPLVIFVGVVDITKVAQQIIEANVLEVPMASFYVYGGLFFIYFLLCYPLSLASIHLEKKWN